MEDHIINNEFNNNITIPNETIIHHQEENIQQPQQIELNQQIQEEIQQPQDFGNQTIAEDEMRDEVQEVNTEHQEIQSNDVNQQVGEMSNINETNDVLDNNETNDALMEQIMESENAAMKDEDLENTIDTDNQGTVDDNVNRTIEENVGENDQLNQSNFENVVTPSEVQAPVTPVSTQTTTNKRQLDLEIEQLAKHRKLLEEERRKIEEQISILENEEMNYEEPPELSLSQCTAIITKLKKVHEAIIWPFLIPVDPIKLGIPQYPDIIKNPMDIATISNKLKKKDYASYLGFVADMNLIWDNAILFNGDNSDIGRWAIDLKEATRALVDEALKKKVQDRKKTAGVPKAPPKVSNQVEEIKKFIEKVRHDPSTLSQPKFQFFTDFISSLDIKK